MLEAKGSPKCTSAWQDPANCFRTLNSQQFSNFTLSNWAYWQAPSVPWGALWCGNRHSHSFSSKLPAALTLYPCLSLPNPPSWARLEPSHTLDRGHLPEKYYSTFKTNPQCRKTATCCQLPNCTHNLGSSHPLPWSPQLASASIKRIPFLHVIPSRHPNLGLHGQNWSLPPEAQQSQSHLGPHLWGPCSRRNEVWESTLCPSSHSTHKHTLYTLC